jgi:hypothetical protein
LVRLLVGAYDNMVEKEFNATPNNKKARQL